MASTTATVKLNLSGDWIMDKSQSTNLDAILQLQGVGWVKRKAILMATVTLKIIQDTDDADPDSDGWISFQQVVTGGMRSVAEKHRLDWATVEHNDITFGRASCSAATLLG
ncbi:hypothetical protein BJX64DRAFT_293035 [Aspergillus heterothallicus]